MAQFSNANNVRQFYVVKSLVDNASAFTDANDAGAIQVKYDNATTAKDTWFNYVTPNGEQGNNKAIRTDIVGTPTIKSITPSKIKTRKLKRLEITLDPTINSGTPVLGQEYILRFTFYGLGLGGPENQYLKDGGAYRAITANPADVYENLAVLAKLNFSREVTPYVKVYTDEFDPYTAYSTPNKPANVDLPGTSTKLIIEEVLQPWVLGKRQADQVNFAINAVPILFTGGYYPWGVIEETTKDNTNVVPQGRIVADMEWFFIGERADKYRGMGYPDNFETKYLANPSKNYTFLDISYGYVGDEEDVQRTPKVLTLAVEEASATVFANVNAIVAALPANIRPAALA